MKKIIVTSLVFVLAVCSIQAQSKPSFGFKAGLNFVSLSGDGTDDLDNSTGYHAGIVFHAPLAKKFGIQAEALYSLEGAKDFELGYINIPILATYKLIPGLRFQAGPQFKIKANTDLEAIPELLRESAEDDIKGFNFDGAVGFEYKFPVVGVFLQVRYNFGVTDIGKDNVEAKNNAFQLSAGYRF